GCEAVHRLGAGPNLPGRVRSHQQRRRRSVGRRTGRGEHRLYRCRAALPAVLGGFYMRNKTVKFGGKKVRVEEKRIGELEKLVVELFPDSKGDISKIQISSLLDQAGFGLLYEKIPVIFPDVTD